MDSNSTEFEVPRAVQKAAALGGLVIDAYLAAHESRQARIAPQAGSKRPHFAEVLKQAGSSIPGLQDALVALAGEENAADLKKLVELVGDNPDLAALVRKATMNARGVVASDRRPPSAPRPAGGGEDLNAALGDARARGEEADSRAQLLAMLRASVEERLALMEARLNGRVSALQQRVVHLEASIDGLAQDIERLKQRVRERRDAASRTAPVREPEPTVLPGDAADPAPQSVEGATVEPTPSTPETSTASPRLESPGQVDVVGPASATQVGATSTAPPPEREAAILANGPPAAERDAGADQLLMTLLDARESEHDARITEGEHAVAILEKHVVTLTAQVRELTELHNDA